MVGTEDLFDGRLVVQGLQEEKELQSTRKTFEDAAGQVVQYEALVSAA